MEALALVLPAPEVVDQVPIEAVPGVMMQLTALALRLGVRLASAAAQPPTPPEPDELLDAAQTAAMIRRSVSWVRRQGHTLPGFSQPQGKGTAARWSRRQLAGWISPE
jgi:hypothetical protein